MSSLGVISGIISGMILFQTSVVAPIVFTILDAESASKFLRKIFPRFFLVILLFGVLCLFISLFLKDTQGIIVSSVTITSMSISYLVVPATNRARDEEKSNTFRRLHTLTVVLTLFTLLANLSWLLPI